VWRSLVGNSTLEWVQQKQNVGEGPTWYRAQIALLHTRLLVLFCKSRVGERHQGMAALYAVLRTSSYDRLLMFVCAGLRLDCRSGTGESFLMDVALGDSFACLF
jgi:hypothetical protein